MEWPELVEELLPEETLRVTLMEQNDGSRMLTFDV
jgi:tRNA threonylcarbamoyladenosine biosynthesis protein TsaE